MQNLTVEKIAPQVVPYNETAEYMHKIIFARATEQINFFAREYKIEEPQSIGAFLGDNAFLLDLLEEVTLQIHKCFGAENKLLMRLLPKRESFDDERLFVHISTALPKQEAALLIEDFDKKWWLQNEHKFLSKVVLNLEFKK